VAVTTGRGGYYRPWRLLPAVAVTTGQENGHLRYIYYIIEANMINTKIVCTIGPASSDPVIIRQMIDAGMSVARINFSHGSHEEHREKIDTLKRLRSEMKKNIAILQDLSGPKIRVGVFPNDVIELTNGSLVMLKSKGDFDLLDKIPSIPVSYPCLTDDVKVGERILLDDGNLEMRVDSISENNVSCIVVRGGILKSHKGVNFPGIKLSIGAPTDKDIEDLLFGVEMEVDFVALSFVQSAEDIEKLKAAIKKRGGKQKIIAKLEREMAIENLDSITEAADGIMVARGDLGIEADIAMVPVYQKQIVEKCIEAGKPVIVATQMLESMIGSPMPTRAEANDVATAIFDRSDGIMLSGETAVGDYPVETVRMMQRIARNAEMKLSGSTQRRWQRDEIPQSEAERALARAVCRTAEALQAKAIVTQTISGGTARLISMNRPSVPIIATTPVEQTYYHMSLIWGVHAFLVPKLEEVFMESVHRNDQILIEAGALKKGDLVVITAGIPAGKAGGSNVMKLHIVGEG
jgi:pyruvate kinase